MVHTREPENTVAAHSFPSNQDILDGSIQGMAHMEGACDIGRRNNNSERFIRRMSAGSEQVTAHPELIPFFFCAIRVEVFV
jgi:hypothetical protein